MLLNDDQIRRLLQEGMIRPYVPSKKRVVDDHSVISYGLGSASYDIRLGREFKILRPGVTVLDPKNSRDCWDDLEVDEYYDIPPGGFVLAAALEQFDIPPDVFVVVIGKSTYCRVAMFANISPMEPGWRGKLTMELANLAPVPVRVYVGEGIAACLIFHIEKTSNPYWGNYQYQSGVTPSEV